MPASDLDGESAWPTQPLPLRPPPFARQELTEDNLTRRTVAAHAAVLERFRRLRSGGQFVPPSREGTVILPGFDGGGEWGGAAWDPETGLLYANASEMPWILTMVEVDALAGAGANARRPALCAALRLLPRSRSRRRSTRGSSRPPRPALATDAATKRGRDHSRGSPRNAGVRASQHRGDRSPGRASP